MSLGLGLGLSLRTPRGASSPYAAYALALDFEGSEYWAGGTRAANLAALSGYSFTRTGEQRAEDTDDQVDSFAANVPAINGYGYHCYGALTNLLLNAGGGSSIVTQNVTVTAQAYTLSFRGSGTVTLSGASTAGPLVGTGTTDQVALTFTPSAGTLTLTVSGSVRYAVLIARSLAVPVPIIATGASTVAIDASDLRVGFALDTARDLFFWHVLDGEPLAGDDVAFCFRDDGGSHYILAYRSGDSWVVEVNGASGGSVGVSVTGIDQRHVIGFRWTAATNTIKPFAYNGAHTSGAATAVSRPTGLDQLCIGSQAGSFPFDGQHKGMFVRHATLSDAEIEDILETA
jgi:hypothetical protein